MNVTPRRERLRALLAGDRCVYAPSVFDPISARIAEDLGFEIGFMASSVPSAAVLGAPELGVLTLTEFAQQVRRICRAGSISLMVVSDNCFGNALNDMRSVEELESAGVSAINIEDVAPPVSFGSAEGEESWKLIPLEEAVGKMKAALAARQDPSLVVAARTKALSLAGIPETIRRVQAYEKAGVDAIFLSEARTRREELESVHAETRLPLLLGRSWLGEPELADQRFLAGNGVRMVSLGNASL